MLDQTGMQRLMAPLRVHDVRTGTGSGTSQGAHSARQRPAQPITASGFKVGWVDEERNQNDA